MVNLPLHRLAYLGCHGAHGKAGNGNGHGKRKRTWKTETTFTRSVFCANFWFMTELDACMCAVVCDKLVWTVLCAVR